MLNKVCILHLQAPNPKKLAAPLDLITIDEESEQDGEDEARTLSKSISESMKSTEAKKSGHKKPTSEPQLDNMGGNAAVGTGSQMDSQDMQIVEEMKENTS